MEMMDSEQLKRELPFDLYGRYALTRDIINGNRGFDEKLIVLDVGGRGNIMQMFLPDDEVSYLDPNLEAEEQDENYLEGDGCDIRVEDGSFDFVVSADVYEHIQPERRKDFIRENLRVARMGVILAAPFYTDEVELAERYANESYKVISGGDDHIWLNEHSKYGLPLEREIEDFIRAEGYDFQKIPNNNLWLWEYLICIYFVAREQAEQFRQLNLLYNEKLYAFDHEEHSYRKIYFIKKAENLKDMELSANGIDTNLHLEAISKGFDVMAHIYAKDKADIEQLRLDNAGQAREILKQRDEIMKLNEEIERMLTSRSWKISKPLRDFNAIVQKIKGRP
jgi:hypothetical protein